MRRVSTILLFASCLGTLHCCWERDVPLSSDIDLVAPERTGSRDGSSGTDYNDNDGPAPDASRVADGPLDAPDDVSLDAPNGEEKEGDGGAPTDAGGGGTGDGSNFECSDLEPAWKKSDFKEVSFRITNLTRGTIYIDTAYFQVGKLNPDDGSWTLTDYVTRPTCPCREYCDCSDISSKDGGEVPFCTVDQDHCRRSIFCDPDYSFAVIENLESVVFVWDNYIRAGRRFLDCFIDVQGPTYFEKNCVVFESLGAGVFKLALLYSNEPIEFAGFEGKTACLQKEFVVATDGVPADVTIDIVDEPTLEDQSSTPTDERCCVGLCRFR